MIRPPGAMYSAATDHGEFLILVAGKRPSQLMAGNNDEVYDKKPQRYAEDNVTPVYSDATQLDVELS